jgi:hypothetical protein
MMRFISGLLFILTLSFPLYYFLPWCWWSAVIPAFLIGFGLQMKGVESFLCGFISLGLFWFSMAYWSNSLNDSELLNKMSTLLPFGSAGSTFIAITIIGGLLGGLATMSGQFLRDIISGAPTTSKKRFRGRFK